jgi:hypothetical protein
MTALGKVLLYATTVTYAVAHLCPVGQYELGGICTECAKGTYSGVVGTQGCNECSPGSAATQLGSSSCERCRKGTYSDTGGSPICKNCTIDQTTYGVGYTYCGNCGEGYYTSEPGSPQCEGCRRNKDLFNPGPQKEWSWSTHSCVVACADKFLVYSLARTNEYGNEEWGCMFDPFEYSRLWGVPTLPEHETPPWRAEDMPGILARHSNWWLQDWMCCAATAAPPTTPPQSTTQLTTPPPSTTQPTTPPPSTTPQPTPAVVAATHPSRVTLTPAADAISTNNILIIGLISGGGIIAVLVLVSVYCWVEKVRGTSSGHHAMTPAEGGMFHGVVMLP